MLGPFMAHLLNVSVSQILEEQTRLVRDRAFREEWKRTGWGSWMSLPADMRAPRGGILLADAFAMG
jgi:hypothetical protein